MTDFAAPAPPALLGPALRRRTFLRVAGASVASAALVLAGCTKDTPTPVVVIDPNLIRLQAGDTGLLNYCYLFKQLQAGLYQKVVDAYPADFSAADKLFFTDLRDHEVVQRATLFAALGNSYLPQLPFNWPALGTRAQVLALAQRLEDQGVAALAGAIPLVLESTTRTLLSKMLSVEARHAALVRDLASPGTFAGSDVVPAGLNQVLTPTEGIAATAALLAPIVISVADLPVV